MTIDRGGLQYRLEVENRFSESFEAFHRGLRDATSAYDNFESRIKGISSASSNFFKFLQSAGTQAATLSKQIETLQAAQARLRTAQSGGLLGQTVSQTRQETASVADFQTRVREAADRLRRLQEQQTQYSQSTARTTRETRRLAQEEVQAGEVERSRIALISRINDLIRERASVQARLESPEFVGQTAELRAQKSLLDQLIQQEQRQIESEDQQLTQLRSENALLRAQQRLQESGNTLADSELRSRQTALDVERRILEARRELDRRTGLAQQGLTQAGRTPDEEDRIQTFIEGDRLRAQFAREKTRLESEVLQRLEGQNALLRAQNRLEQGKLALDNDQLRETLGEEAAVRRILAAERERATLESLAARGLGRRGISPEDEARARAIAETERDRNRALTIRERLQSDISDRVSRELELARTQEKIERTQNELQDQELQDLRAQNALERERIRLLQRQQQLEARRRTAPERAELRFQEALEKAREERLIQNLSKTSRGFRLLGDEIQRSEQRANRISFTFRRLFGILATFTIARRLVFTFREIVRETLRFNAEIEQAQLGAAALFTAVGQVRGAFGDAVEGAEALNLAQAESRRQLGLLRRDSLRTAATFDRLAETFQIAIAPGFTAGLDLDEIRKLTVQISQAAAAIGLPQNQLAEEIRSLLTGTIQARTTRIATALGITNEDIRNAKELGQLAEFLNDRFAAFTVAGEEALNTFNAILTNVRDSLLLIFSTGSEDFFAELKSELKALLDFFVNETEEGFLEPNPQAVSVVRQIFDALRDAVAIAGELARSLDFNDVSTGAEGFAGILRTVAQVLAGIVQGFITGFANVVRAFEVLRNGAIRTFRSIGIEIERIDLQSLVATVTKLFVSFFSVSVAVSALVASLKLALVPVGALAAIAITITRSFLGLLGIVNRIGIALVRVLVPSFVLARANVQSLVDVLKIGLTAALSGLKKLVLFALTNPIGIAITGVVALIGWFKQVADSVLGIELSWREFLSVLGVVSIRALESIANYIQFAFQRTLLFIQTTAIKIGQFVSSTVLGFLADALDTLSAVDPTDTLERASKALAKTRRELNNSLDLSIAKLEREKELASDQLETQERLSRARKNAELASIRAEASARVAAEEAQQAAEGFQDSLLGVPEIIRQAFLELAGVSEKPVLELNKEANKLRTNFQSFEDVFKRIPATITASAESLAPINEAVQKLRENSIEAGQELQRAVATSGNRNATLVRLQTLAIEEQFKVRKEEESLTRARELIERQITNVQEEQLDFLTNISAARGEERTVLQGFLNLNLERLATEEDLRKTTLDRIAVENRLKRLREKAPFSIGFEQEEELKALRDEEDRLKRKREQIFEDVRDAEQVIRSTLGDVVTDELVVATARQTELVARQAGLQAQLNSLAASRRTLELELANTTAIRIRALVTEELPALKETTQELELQERAQKRLFDAQNTQNPLLVRAAELANQTDQIRQQGRLVEEQIRTEREKTQALREQLQTRAQIAREELTRALDTGDNARAKELEATIGNITAASRAAGEAYGEFVEQADAKTRILNDQLEQTQEQLDKLEGFLDFLSTNPAFASLAAAVVEFADGLLVIDENGDIAINKLQVFSDIALGILNEFADLGKGLIQSIFDPDTSAKEKFRSFLNDVGDLFLTTFTKIITARAFLALASFFGAPDLSGLGSILGGGIGGARGGKIPENSHATPSRAHFHPHVQSFARGGDVAKPVRPRVFAKPPRGIDPRDRVPGWLRPGERVIRPEIASRLPRFWRALNNGRINLDLLNNLPGVENAGRERVAKTTLGKLPFQEFGFAGGGLVPGGAAQSTDSSGPLASRSSAGPAGVSLIVPDDQSMDRMLAGGEGAWLQFMESKRDYLRQLVRDQDRR